MGFRDALPVAVLTGQSGAGKSTALNAFEDMGYYCLEGLPARLVPEFLSALSDSELSMHRGLAVGLDLRHREFLGDWKRALARIEELGSPPQLLFFEADLGELKRRYATTRRPHPLERFGQGLEQALQEEKELMAPLRDSADLVVDTTSYSVHDLRRLVQRKWAFLEGKEVGLRVHVISFGYKYRAPNEADLVFDLRFLPNPYFDERLRPMSGQDPEVAEYVLGNDLGREFSARIEAFLRYVVPLYAAEGRYRLTICFGCTGGRHRSVAVAERMHAAIASMGYVTTLEHRNIEHG